MNKGNQKLYLPVKNKTKAKAGKQKQGANWGIKQWKKETNKYVERKGKKEWICTVRGRWRTFMYLKD